MATPKPSLPMSIQRKATIISTATALLLVCAKLIIGIISGSVAVLASAIDSILDVSVSLFNYFAVKKAEEAPNDAFPYGKGKVQAIAGVIEGTIITLSGVYIIYAGLTKMVENRPTHLLTPSIAAMSFSLVITFFLVRYLQSVADKSGSLVIKADALHYKTDLFSNGAVLASLLLVQLSGFDAIDALFGIGIGAYIIYSAYEIIKESVAILLDRALDQEVVKKIATFIDAHPLVQSHHWLKTRTDGIYNFVEFHLVLRPNMTLGEAHKIADEIEEQIICLDPDKQWIITPHFDPYDDEAVNDAMMNGNYPKKCHKTKQ